jgi:hypothetical protein
MHGGVQQVASRPVVAGQEGLAAQDHQLCVQRLEVHLFILRSAR